MLNRSTDGGATWTLNGMAGGIIVANADSTQPTPKFGTVNALLGGVDHAAVDPSNGDVYYVYGNRDAGTGNNRLAIRRIQDNGGGGVTVGPENFVTGQVVSCSSTGGGVCSGSNNNRTVTFASLASGQSETITFVANVNCSVAEGTEISNTASVTSFTPDPDLTNNSAMTTTTASNPPPTITGAEADPSVLWPPNHRMVNVTVSYDVTDNCPLPFGSCTLSVTSNEPVLGHGSGHRSPDWIVVDDHHVLLRAEREGNGNGRVYTTTITCTDSGGNSSDEQVEVVVPHDRGRR